MKTTNLMTIGTLARCARVGVETIRYYERQGLLEQPFRKESGYRLYTEDSLRRLRFIAEAKNLGFTLKEIKELLQLSVQSPSAHRCEDVRLLAEVKLANIREKIALLQRMESVLQRLVEDCTNRVRTEECPILSVLDRDDEMNEGGMPQ